MTGGGDNHGGRRWMATLTSCPPVPLLSATAVATLATAVAAIATAAAVFAITLLLVVDCCLPPVFLATATATVTVAAATTPVTIAVIHFLHLCLYPCRLHLQVGWGQRRTVAVDAMIRRRPPKVYFR